MPLLCRMPPKRSSPKQWASKRPSAGSSGKWARRARVPVRRTGPPTMTFAGVARAVRSAPNVHKFMRWGPALDFVSGTSGGVPVININPDSGGTSVSLAVGLPAADTSGVPSNYQVGAAMAFKVTDVPNYTDFTALFDQYRLDQVDIEISNLHNNADAGTAVTLMPSVTYCPDFDDGAVPSNSALLSQRQRTKQWTFRGNGQPLKFSVRPRTAAFVYKPSGTTIGYAVGTENTYVNVANNDVPYYGVKLWFSDMYISGTGSNVGETHLRVKCRYHFSMKDPE